MTGAAMPELMHQTAPYPHALAAAVRDCSYRAHEGWTVRLEDDLVRDVDADNKPIGRGMTLVITTQGYDSYAPERGRNYGVRHFFIVPAATYGEADWERWLFEQFAKVELHEAMEHFTIGDRRPFPPTHGVGRDPYIVREYVDEADRSTRYDAHISRRAAR